MKRYMTAYYLETDEIKVFTKDNYKKADEPLPRSDWVWQFAEDEEIAKNQHFQKLAEWEADPTKDTY